MGFTRETLKKVTEGISGIGKFYFLAYNDGRLKVLRMEYSPKNDPKYIYI